MHEQREPIIQLSCTYLYSHGCQQVLGNSHGHMHTHGVRAKPTSKLVAAARKRQAATVVGFVAIAMSFAHCAMI
jgi:hypothetical protein